MAQNENDENGKWENGPTLSEDQLLRWKLTRAEQRAATAEFRQAEANLRAWIASQPEVQLAEKRLAQLEKAMTAAIDAEGTMRKQLEGELDVDLAKAQVNLETGETRVPLTADDDEE